MKKKAKKKTGRVKTKEEPASLNLAMDKITPPDSQNPEPTKPEAPPTASVPAEQPFFKTEVISETPSFEKKDELEPVKEPLASPAKPENNLQIFEPEDKKSSQSLLKLIFFFFLGFILGGAAVFAFFYLNPLNLNILTQKKAASENKKKEAAAAPVPTIDATIQEATASEEMQEGLDVSGLSLEILNGSGVAGAAAKSRDTLKKDGFVTFTLGNASDYKEASTEVKLKEEVKKEVFDLIEKALTDYDVVLSDSNLASDSEFDIKITLGTKK